MYISGCKSSILPKLSILPPRTQYPVPHHQPKTLRCSTTTIAFILPTSSLKRSFNDGRGTDFGEIVICSAEQSTPGDDSKASPGFDVNIADLAPSPCRDVRIEKFNSSCIVHPRLAGRVLPQGYWMTSATCACGQTPSTSPFITS